ncbi:MAG TPA: WD40 repeat domain-containing protein, partial [Ktedonobacterales bacterium]|nr:WD40 repeat domain-containing protein [Ktedonobacterales bacterium]
MESFEDTLLTRRQMLRGIGMVTLGAGATLTLIACGSPTGPTTLGPTPTPTKVPKPAAGAPATLVQSVLLDAGPAYGIAFGPDSIKLVTAGLDQKVRIWDANNGGLPLATLSGLGDSVISATYAPDGSKVAAGSVSNLIGVWNSDKDQSTALFTLSGHE